MLLTRTWSSESSTEWQKFYDRASRSVYYGKSGSFHTSFLPALPTYEDLKVETCHKQ